MVFKNGLKEVPISSGKVILSDRKTQNFRQLFQDLSFCDHIYISTFNYYMEQEFNDVIIEKVDSINDIRVVLNAYSKETLNKILNKSVKVNRFVQLFYDENNHSKIISNGKLMYIGSANYTGYTKDNFEVGVTIEDKSAIENIEKDVFLNLMGYRAIITDPIQPLVIFFCMFYRGAIHQMNSIKNYFDGLNRGFMEEFHIESDYEFLNNFIKIYQNVSKDLLNYLKKRSKDFYEDGVLITNLISDISKKVDNLESGRIGERTSDEMNGWIEDYRACLPEYKKLFSREIILLTMKKTLHQERAILQKYEVIMDLLLYLRTRWIKEHIRNVPEHYLFCDEKIVTWMFNCERVSKLSKKMLK